MKICEKECRYNQETEKLNESKHMGRNREDGQKERHGETDMLRNKYI